MLAYAASRPRIAARGSSPSSMLLIASAHVVAIALLVSAKMDLPMPPAIDPPLRIKLLPLPKPPPPPEPNQSPVKPLPMEHPYVAPDPVPLPPVDHSTPTSVRPTPDFTRDVLPVLPDPPTVKPAPDSVHLGPRLITPHAQLKPPYPRSKLLSEEEAALPLKLTIDERGRVIAVEAAGPADPVFLEAARRHLLAHWRYVPASEDGRPVRSTVRVTLRFQLDG